MIYAYDKAAQIPLVDLYDTLMMLAEVAAAKDMYEKGLELMKDFRKEYGDLMFSDPSAQEYYNREFNVGDFVNNLYANGIDPTRSMEGRALLSRWVNSRPYGNLNILKQADVNRKAYLESIAKAGDAYDPDFETFLHGQDPRQWRDVNPDGTMNPFTLTSVTPYTNLHDMVHPTFLAIKPHLLNADQVKNRGYDYDPMYDYEGITEEDMRKALEDYLPGIRNNTSYKYLRHLAEQDLIREGNPNPTPSQIDERFVQNAITSDAGIMTPLLRNKNISGDDWLDAQKSARDFYYKKLERANTPGFDSNGNPITDDIDPEGTFNWDELVYGSGLKNAAGIDPGVSLPEGAMEAFDGSPEMWKEYKKRVLYSGNGADAVTPFIHLRGMLLETLEKYLKREHVNKGADDDVDLTGGKYINATTGDLSNIISAQDLGAAIKWSAGYGGHPYTEIPKRYTAHKLANKYAEKGRLNYSFTVDVDLNNGIVTAFVAGRWRSYAPIILQNNGSYEDERRGYYYELPTKSVFNHGTPKQFEVYGTSTAWDNLFELGRMPGNENMSQAVRVGARGDKSTATDHFEP